MQHFWSKRVGTLLVALLAGAGLTFLAPATARAQNTNSGTVIGQVTDAQGGAVVGAVVILSNAATNGAQPTVTNKAGRYTFVNLQPGTYTIDVKKDGFKEAIVKNQSVDVGKQLTINVPLQVGAATQTVEVTASGAELQTLNATVSNTVSGEAIAMLPSLSRDANGLTNLQPNTAPDGGVAGADRDQNSFTLDGGQNSDDMDGSHASYTGTQAGATSGVMPTPAASIEQFSVGVSNQSADVNSAAGSSVAMVTKRGTDAVHGSVYEYYLGSRLGANSWSNDRTGSAKAISHQNRFGAALGGEIIPKWLGGKTYLFGNFEGRRYPNAATFEHDTPSPLLRAGIIQVDPTGKGTLQPYNLNTTSKQIGGVTYDPAVCTGYADGSGGFTKTGNCDPRGLGLNPIVSGLWSKYMPTFNDATSGDQANQLGYKSNTNASLASNFFVARLDHDFGSKNHFSATYHFFSYNPFYTGGQVDIGGALPGDTLGNPATQTVRPQLPSMSTVSLTSSLTSNITNSFHYSYLRNFWQWSGANLSPQPGTGLDGALEIGGESRLGSLIPYNVNTQNVRSRFWDGIGHTFSDDVSVIHGNHLIQFGGKYTHQWDYHQRNDNGGGIMAANVMQLGGNTHSIANGYLPVATTFGDGTTEAGFGPGADTSSWNKYYNEVLGIVDQGQTLYTRSGPQLNLQKLGTPMYDQSNIPMYNVYFSDAWHLRPDLTFTYGTGYTVEMPPLEAQGKQVELVDAASNLVTTSDYLAATQRAAAAGQTYNPTLGFATVANVGAGLKYPYHPFYGGLSPRLSLAWNPNISGGILGSILGGNKSVIRGGWSRIYGRLNGVDLVLVPLLGTGLGQPVACLGANNGTPNSAGVAPVSQCNGTGGADPLNAFRVGVDGTKTPVGTAPTATLPQPYFPGTVQNGVINASAGSGEVLDPNFKPNRSDEFDLTIQRQITSSFSTEVGYTGRILRNEYQGVNLDAVPYMMTAGGQQFQAAYANLWQQLASGATVTAQPFFEAALGGPTSSSCKAYASCTAAVAAKYGPSGKKYISTTVANDVYSLWNVLNKDASWTLGRTFPSAPTATSGSGQLQAIFMNASNGYGNFNSLFWSVSMRNFHGLTAMSNFTWSRAFGTGQTTQATSSYTVTDPWNMHAMYGPQYNDTPLNYNLYFVYQPGAKTQHGLIGHLAHGWAFAPILTWQDGGMVDVNLGGDCASFGETDCNAASTYETAVKKTAYTGGSSVTANAVNATTGSRSNASSNGTGMNRFGNNAAAVYSQFRPMVLGLDTTGTSGVIPGLAVWNVDFSVTKDLALSERFHTELNAQASNVFNHFSPSTYTLDLNNARNFGAVNGDALGPRTVEVGLTVNW